MTEQPVTPSETIEAFLKRSARPKRAVPIRGTFLQQGTSGDGAVPGPIAEFVTHGDETAFDLWLLVREEGTARTKWVGNGEPLHGAPAA